MCKTREWARANGHPVSARGRISATVQEPYKGGSLNNFS